MLPIEAIILKILSRCKRTKTWGLREVDDEATSLSLHNKKQTKNLDVKQFAKNILLSLGV